MPKERGLEQRSSKQSAQKVEWPGLAALSRRSPRVRCIAQWHELRISNGRPLPQTRRTETAALGARREVEGNHVSALVDRALGSVERMCSSGRMVVFDDDGSCVLNKMTGEERGRKWETTSWTCG